MPSENCPTAPQQDGKSRLVAPMFLYENKPPAIIAIDLDNMSNQASKIRANSMIRSRGEKNLPKRGGRAVACRGSGLRRNGAQGRVKSEQMPETMSGGCHCGRVRFRVTADLARITDCNCSFCTKKGFLDLIVAPEQFELLSGADALTTYRFNTGTARHTFCATCGIHPFYVPRSDPDKIDVNVRCLDGVDIAALKVHRFDGQNWEHAITERVPWR